MSLLSSRPALRWALPLGVLGVVAAVTGASTLSASAGPSLPDRTAAQLLVDLQKVKVDGFSGTIVQNADLGLPSLPSVGGQGSSSLSSLVTGSHTLRVWQSGLDKTRLALLGTLGESDVIRNGTDLWTWSSQDNTAAHLTLPARDRGAPPSAADLPKTPQEAADRALAAIDPTTRVSTDGTAEVAGRPAYELVIAPRDSGSKIGQVRIAIDAETKLPLRARILARGATTPAVDVGFTQITMVKPGDEHFRFTPPPGAKVTEHRSAIDKPMHNPAADAARGGKPTVLGAGWTSVLVTSAPATGQGELGAVLGALPRVSGPWGSGRLLSSKLFSALLTDDGRLLVGAVDKEALFTAATAKAAK